MSSKTFSIFDEILRSKNGGIACSVIFSFEPSSLAILESGYNSKMASAGRRHVLLTGSPGKYLFFLVKKKCTWVNSSKTDSIKFVKKIDV